MMATSIIDVNRLKYTPLCEYGVYNQVGTEINLSEPISYYEMLVFYIGWDDVSAGRNFVLVPFLSTTNVLLISRIGEIVVDIEPQKVTIRRIVRNNPVNPADGSIRTIGVMRF